jgi:hypothetical protein
VKITAQANRGIWLAFIPTARMPITVTSKLILPRILLKPLMCSASTAKSTLAPEC